MSVARTPDALVLDVESCNQLAGCPGCGVIAQGHGRMVVEVIDEFGWLNSYLPFYVMAALAANPFFTYLLLQFFRGIPKDLDEAAYIDGAGRWKILTKVILPLAKAPIVSAALFQTVWTQ